jgi:S1-C subfamily serine protease
VKSTIPRLQSGQAIARPYLGVSTAADSGGAAVQEATAGGPAEQAGVRAGDVIVAVDGKRIQSPDDVAAAIQDKQPGESVDVEVRRDGDAKTIAVKLGTRPEQAPQQSQPQAPGQTP